MRRRSELLAALFVVVILAVGCYESRDAPGAAARDGGSQGLDGGMPRFDGAPPPIPDGAPAPRDAQVAPDGPGDGAVECGDVVAPYAGPGCAEETRACVESCGPGALDCMDACVSLDAECDACATRTVISCANSLGCQATWDEFACCARDTPECAPLSGADLVECAAPVCDEHLIDYEACIGTIDRAICAEKVSLTCGLPMT